MTEDAALPLARAQDEVAELLSDLIRIDTTNTGSTATSAGERVAAEWVAGKLDEVGIPSVIHESERGRASLVARIEGSDRSRSALLVHGHLDVVPADPAEWSVHPFSGEERDGYVWGRGAVDMKDMDAMTLALVRDWARTGVKPDRDIVLAYAADEEAGGRKGAHFLVDEEVGALAATGLLVGGVGQHDVAVGFDAGAGPVAHQREGHGVHVLHVDRAAAPDVAVALLAGERVHAPLGRVGGDDVQVAVDQQGRPRAVAALDAGDQAGPPPLGLVDDRGDADLVELARHPLGGDPLAGARGGAPGVRRVDADEVREQLGDLVLGSGQRQRRVLGHGGDRATRP